MAAYKTLRETRICLDKIAYTKLKLIFGRKRNEFFQIAVVDCGGGGWGGRRDEGGARSSGIHHIRSHRHMPYCYYSFSFFFLFVAPEKNDAAIFFSSIITTDDDHSRWNSFGTRRVGFQSHNLMYYIMVGRSDYEHFSNRALSWCMRCDGKWNGI